MGLNQDNSILSNAIKISSTYNVGIGTSSPLVKLHVTQPAGTTTPTLGTSSGGLFVAGDSNQYGLYIGNDGNTGSSWIQAMRNNTATAYNILLNPVGGNVGIGTSSPSIYLTVNDRTGSRTNSQDFIAQGNSIKGHIGVFNNKLYMSSNWYYDGTQRADSTSYGQAAIIFDTQNVATGTNLNFGTSEIGSTEPIERMRITSSGIVLIGTTANSGVKFQVTSTGDAIHSKCDNGGTSILCNPAATNCTSAYFRVGSTNAGFIGHPTSSTTSYNTSPSDERLKYNIEIWDENVLESFKNINPKIYSHIADEDETIRYKGYIAQEMIDKFPEAYPVDRDGFYNYNPSAMVVYLTKAIQELKAEIDILKQQ